MNEEVVAPHGFLQTTATFEANTLFEYQQNAKNTETFKTNKSNDAKVSTSHSYISMLLTF